MSGEISEVLSYMRVNRKVSDIVRTLDLDGVTLVDLDGSNRIVGIEHLNGPVDVAVMFKVLQSIAVEGKLP